MSHFSHDALANDPEALERLRTVLHGREAGGSFTVPSLADRFPVRTDARPAPVRAATVDPRARPVSRGAGAAERLRRKRASETLATS
ncbi:hypothetical protein [Methylobacterium trifolii]|uniref:Uncharacterized protein n=1 Tax=Methylobacterium trifolii TaxID=1003092 RepID=A0ABQ4TV03_9HYPH|nr:hypothetical protein [Methylobacterium trifolii]GJE58749.1 hypothetical protein MPOCJGCO_0832 [Methylobacterium trifolii]